MPCQREKGKWETKRGQKIYTEDDDDHHDDEAGDGEGKDFVKAKVLYISKHVIW